MYDPTLGSVARKARIEIIPLIDVVFFLLATFVLFTLSLEKLRILEAPLPRTGPPRPEEVTVFLEATDQNLVSWKVGQFGTAELITLGDLGPRLSQYQTQVPVARVAINGDRRASFGASIRILDSVRAAGIKQVCIQTADETGMGVK